MKHLFRVNVWLDSAGNYVADTISFEEGQTNRAVAKRLPVLMKTVSSRISKRRQHNVRFPPPEKRIIVSPNGNGSPRLIVPAHN